MEDPFDLNRFIAAQNDVLPKVLAELKAGEKRSHWIWFVFPQIKGLGHSAMAQRYAIQSLGEAQAYIAHPVLGARLRECTEIVNALSGKTAHQIFGSPDDLKFHSSMTLFAHATDSNAVFVQALHKYFGGAQDPKTLERL